MTRERHVQKNDQTDDPALTFLKHLGKSVGITLLVGSGLLLTVSLIISFTPDPLALTSHAGFCIGMICSFLCGRLTCRVNGGKWLLCGFLSEAALSAIYLILSLFFPSGTEPYWILRAVCLLLSMLGAFSAVRFPPRKHPKHRKRQKG